MPSLSGPLISYKQFLENHGASIDRGDAQTIYDKYKIDWETKQANEFIAAHVNDCWFKEKYDPLLSFKWHLAR